MTLSEKIDMLGDPIAQHLFTGTFDGVAVALYQIDGSTLGTHFAALIDPDEIQVMPIQSEPEAREAFRFLVDGVKSAQPVLH